MASDVRIKPAISREKVVVRMVDWIWVGSGMVAVLRNDIGQNVGSAGSCGPRETFARGGHHRDSWGWMQKLVIPLWFDKRWWVDAYLVKYKLNY